MIWPWSGARPLYIAATFILEEGLATEELQRIVDSMRAASSEAGVLLVTGASKAVNRGKGDKVFITTTGLGLVEKAVFYLRRPSPAGPQNHPQRVRGRPRHGHHVAAREPGVRGAIERDTEPLHALVGAMLEAAEAAFGPTPNMIHCLRDPTRGGVPTTLNEIAGRSQVGMELEEKQIPVRETAKGACELLGLDRSMSPTRASWWRWWPRKRPRLC